MDNVAFKLDTYHFVKASLNFDIPEDVTLEIEITPSGTYKQSKGLYNLTFEVKVFCKETCSEIVNVICEAQFSFQDPVKIEKIPDFFYPNSLAILFPYIRAFVSTITLQANVYPILLPTVNLMGLTKVLQNSTIVE